MQSNHNSNSASSAPLSFVSGLPGKQVRLPRTADLNAPSESSRRLPPLTPSRFASGGALGITVDTAVSRHAGHVPKQIHPARIDNNSLKPTAGLTTNNNKKKKGHVPSPIKVDKDLSPFDRYVPIALSIPGTADVVTAMQKERERQLSPDNGLTPIIVVTPTGQEPATKDLLSVREMKSVPRPASSVYTRVASTFTVASPKQHKTVNKPLTRNFSRVTPTSATKVRFEKKTLRERPMSDFTDIDDDDDSPSPLPFQQTPTSLRSHAQPRASIDTVPPTPHRSIGWWNLLVSPLSAKFSVRTNSTKSRRYSYTDADAPDVPLLAKAATVAGAASSEEIFERPHPKDLKSPFGFPGFYSIPMVGEASRYYDPTCDLSTPKPQQMPPIPESKTLDRSESHRTNATTETSASHEVGSTPEPERIHEEKPKALFLDTRQSVQQGHPENTPPKSAHAQVFSPTATENDFAPKSPSPVVGVASVGRFQSARALEVGDERQQPLHMAPPPMQNNSQAQAPEVTRGQLAEMASQHQPLPEDQPRPYTPMPSPPTRVRSPQLSEKPLPIPDSPSERGSPIPMPEPKHHNAPVAMSSSKNRQEPVQMPSIPEAHPAAEHQPTLDQLTYQTPRQVEQTRDCQYYKEPVWVSPRQYAYEKMHGPAEPTPGYDPRYEKPFYGEPVHQSRMEKLRARFLTSSSQSKGVRMTETGERERSPQSLLFIAMSALLFIVILLAVLLSLFVQQKHSDIPVESQWLNLTGFPPLPTGISTISRPNAVSSQSKCVQPDGLWSCYLPKAQQSNVLPNDGDQPNFRLEIRFRNGTLHNSTLVQPLNVTRAATSQSVVAGDLVRRAKIAARDAFSDLIFTALPKPPSEQDFGFLGNTTDNITAPSFAGEETPFHITLLPTTEPSGPKASLSRRGMVTNNHTGLIPQAQTAANGTAADGQLYPYPTAQPLRLFNRGQDDEHYGFSSYFDRSVLFALPSAVQVTATSNSTSDDANSNGGAMIGTANARCVFSETRFVVKIWTRKGATLLGPLKADRNSTSSVGKNNQTESAFDFERPGSFPWPVTVSLDRHGGDASKKGVYCHALDPQTGDVVKDAMAFINEDRGFGGTLVNAATKAFEGKGEIDGGTGGCSCKWENYGR